MTSLKLPGDPVPLLLSEITYLRGENNYTWFYMVSGKRILSSLNLGYYELMLPDFIRIHKSIIVSPDYVASVEVISSAEAVLTLLDNTTFPIAKRRIRTTLALLRKRVEMAPAEVVS